MVRAGAAFGAPACLHTQAPSAQSMFFPQTLLQVPQAVTESVSLMAAGSERPVGSVQVSWQQDKVAAATSRKAGMDD